jgi:hypothetical protein
VPVRHQRRCRALGLYDAQDPLNLVELSLVGDERRALAPELPMVTKTRLAPPGVSAGIGSASSIAVRPQWK